jgi:uncharacterized protein
MSNSLKINVVTIPEEGLNLSLAESGNWFEKCFPADDRPDFVLQKVDIDCHISKTSSTIFIKGKISFLLDIGCGRCLEDAVLHVDSDFTYTLVPAKPETREDLELNAEELEIGYYQGDFIDLTPIVCEQIILQIPIKPLCKEDCKGLCPQCGINLNNASCNCRADYVDERLAVLKKIRIKN